VCVKCVCVSTLLITSKTLLRVAPDFPPVDTFCSRGLRRDFQPASSEVVLTFLRLSLFVFSARLPLRIKTKFKRKKSQIIATHRDRREIGTHIIRESGCLCVCEDQRASPTLMVL